MYIVQHAVVEEKMFTNIPEQIRIVKQIYKLINNEDSSTRINDETML